MYNMQEFKVTDVIIKAYPTYILYGRVKEDDLDEYHKTHNEDLILYKYCMNGVRNVQDYTKIIPHLSKNTGYKHRIKPAEAMCKGYEL